MALAYRARWSTLGPAPTRRYSGRGTERSWLSEQQSGATLGPIPKVLPDLGSSVSALKRPALQLRKLALSNRPCPYESQNGE